jgi:hypothetical protein
MENNAKEAKKKAEQEAWARILKVQVKLDRLEELKKYLPKP